MPKRDYWQRHKGDPVFNELSVAIENANHSLRNALDTCEAPPPKELGP